MLANEIKENTVLSHDLLEGSYLRCALTSDIMLMDGYPSSYISFRTRLYRWIRGDYQILPWLGKTIENKKGEIKQNPLKLLSKYKIFSNFNGFCFISPSNASIFGGYSNCIKNEHVWNNCACTDIFSNSNYTRYYKWNH